MIPVLSLVEISFAEIEKPCSHWLINSVVTLFSRCHYFIQNLINNLNRHPPQTFSIYKRLVLFLLSRTQWIIISTNSLWVLSSFEMKLQRKIDIPRKPLNLSEHFLFPLCLISKSFLVSLQFRKYRYNFPKDEMN